MDGPKVNLKFLQELQNERSESGLSPLIDIGTCPLHIINGAFQTGAEHCGWTIKKTLKGIWQLFHDSPARRDDYETLTGSVTYPMSFCATRWVENRNVADKAVTVWSNIEKNGILLGKITQVKTT